MDGRGPAAGLGLALAFALSGGALAAGVPDSGGPLAALRAIIPGPGATDPSADSEAGPAGPAGPDGTEAEAPYPGAFRVAPETLALVDEAAAARQALARLAEVEGLEAEVSGLRTTAADRAAVLAELGDQALPRLDDLRELRLGLTRERHQLDRLTVVVADRLGRWDELRREWRARERYWRGWDEALAGDPERPALRGELARALEEIGRVLAAATATGPPLVALQRDLVALQGAQRDRAAEVDDAIAERRRRLFHVDASPLFSPAYLAALRAGAAQVPVALGRALRPPGGWLAGRAVRFALVLALAFALALAARRAARLPVADERWRRLLARPLAIGLFVAASTLGLAVRPVPLTWLLLQVLLLAATGARLAGALFFAEPVPRRTAYLLAGLFTLTTMLEAAALPTPWVRLAVAAICLAGGAGLAALLRDARGARDARGEGAAGRVLRLGLAAGLAALAFALVVQVAGLSTLALWLVEGTLATGFIAFVALFLARLTHGGLLVAAAFGGRHVRFVRRHAATLTERLSWLAQIGFAVWGLMLVLEVWEIFETAGDGWRRVLALGIGIGQWRLTLGRALLAAGAVWLAVAASRIVRNSFDGELLERHPLEPGVADTVKTLLHYSLLIAGLLAAASFLGFDLGSFALVAGALGVGIGFGLQNVVNNFVSGLILMFERPVRPGDSIIVDGATGTVRRIGLRSTRVATLDGAEIVVPNSDLISEKVINQTLSDRQVRLLLTFGVAYGSDLEHVRTVAQAVAGAHSEVLEEPAPSCLMTGFGDSSLDFVLRLWISDSDHKPVIQSELLIALERRLREDGIEIPFPQRDIHLVRRRVE